VLYKLGAVKALWALDLRRMVGMYKETLVNETCEFIQKNADQKLNIGVISKKLGISYSYLTHIFKEVTGITVKKYIRKVSIEKAVELMENSNMNITEISLELGYESLSHFSGVFTREVGVSPREYVKKRKNSLLKNSN
jgi:AraC-like DNA-binding protein